MTYADYTYYAGIYMGSVSEEDFLSFVENMNFKGKYFCVFNQDDI